MKRIYLFSLIISLTTLCGCNTAPSQIYYDGLYVPQCANETMVAVYDEQGMYQVPGCVDYIMPYDAEINPDSVEGEFPAVEDNKYGKGEVIMQNLNTRVIAYCRGTSAEIENCVSRLENSCYRRLHEIPSLPAKYDKLKPGSYPTRRWRDGELVPRW